MWAARIISDLFKLKQSNWNVVYFIDLNFLVHLLSFCMAGLKSHQSENIKHFSKNYFNAKLPFWSFTNFQPIKITKYINCIIYVCSTRITITLLRYIIKICLWLTTINHWEHSMHGIMTIWLAFVCLKKVIIQIYSDLFP